MTVMYDIDDILLQRYKIFGYRKGGMGIVYFLTDIKAGTDYAAKTYLPKFGDAEKVEDRFREEAALSLQMGTHRNVLSRHFVKRIEDRPYLFTDYVDGGEKGSTIMDRLVGRALTPELAISFAHQICCGMEFLSKQASVAHLDLKPSNLLVTRDDVVKVGDFGLARQIDPFRIRPTPEHAGSLPYMAPEHFSGSVVDSRADIYSFGVIFYEMLTYNHPSGIDFRNKSREEIHRLLASFHASQDLGDDLYWRGIPEVAQSRTLRDTLPKGIDPGRYRGNDLGVIVGGCLDRFPERRFYRFSYVREALELAFPQYVKTPKRFRQEDSSTTDELQRARDYQELGLHRNALSILNKFLIGHPKSVQAWLSAAASLWYSHREDDALRFVRRALELAPRKSKLREGIRHIEENLQKGGLPHEAFETLLLEEETS